MKAVVFHGKEDLRFEDVPEPSCGPGQIKVKPAWCGICGTDLHEYMGGPSICPTEPHPLTGEKVPLTLGHEFSGVIEELGDGVSERFKVGSRVCVQPILYDGDCSACQDGAINCCDKNGFIGLTGWGGGLSEHVVVPEYAVYQLPDNVSLEVGALVEPLAVGWHAVNMSPFKPTDSVLVLGGGPIGLAVIQALRARGARQIIVSEVAAMRKEFAADFGAHIVLDPTKDDIVTRCKELTGGRGVDVTYDAAGVQPGLDQAILALRARGTHVNIAIWEKRCTIFPNDLVFRERNYMGVATFVKGDFEQVIQAISDGRLNMCRKMITKKVRIDEVVEEGFKTLIKDKQNQVKVLVRLSGEV
ncbi:GroES-like protein [Teratosphaeria nubilosa]|uniref:GroES-like protein n=1 Tax=Teratosphaeria nubilosa TaxID=161662 RepID=A0A6G1L621_9PEZI|nr:GroES-like protein [Teratosphaeria nubilosa]